jgi:hypothetical protein
MSCEEFWDTCPELSDPEKKHAHTAECEACARLLSDQRRLTEGLHASVDQWRRTEAPARVEAGLVAAFRNQRKRQARAHRMWLPVLTWASAAAVLIVLATLAFRGRQPVAPHRAAPAGVQWAVAAMPQAWTADDAIASGDFIPLPSAEQAGENEDVNVVRMEVPRTAMLAVGLPVNLERASEMIEADVMVGSDGLARAVRFVEE